MSALSGYLSFVLYIGAASNAATPEQREMLRTRIKPHLEQLRTAKERKMIRNALVGALTEVHSVIGKEWKPDDKTGEFIARLLREE